MMEYTKIICSSSHEQHCFDSNQNIHMTIDSGCNAISLAIGSGVQVNLVIEYSGDRHDVKTDVVLHEKSSLKIASLFFTHESIAQKYSFVLSGNDSHLDLRGLSVLSGDETITIETSQRHAGVETTSSVEMLSLVDGQAAFDYEGIIHIEEGARDTHANQQNKNIMLSKSATVKSVPTIEVLNKNVQCFHGSAIGTFDRDHQWYLESRGLSQAEVRAILIASFCAPVLDLVPWKSEVAQKIQGKV